MVLALPYEFGSTSQANPRRNNRTYTKMCTFAQYYFDPTAIPAMLEEFLPYYHSTHQGGGHVVVGFLNLLFPTGPPPEDRKDLYPQEHFPAFFHLWSLAGRSKPIDMTFIDIFSRFARDMVQTEYIPFSPFGIFNKEQAEFIFTAVLRIFEVPVGQSSSAYAGADDGTSGCGQLLERDHRKHPIAHHIARWIVMSLSPECLTAEHSVLSYLENFINSIETYYHPSNSGHWTRPLAQFIHYLADFFVLRWNRERNGEMTVPEHRKLNEAIRRRFVLCLRDVVFMGIFAKSSTAMSYSLSALQILAVLEPNLILPGALQRIYPALQGLVEVHRTISAIRALQVLTKTICRSFGYRCHLTSLLGLALPGIDPNDLEKTIQTLAFFQAVVSNIPLWNLGEDPNRGESVGSGLAMQFITTEVARLEEGGPNIEIDYEEELKPEDEELLLRSSTVDLNEFVISLIGRVITLLKNLPDASRVRSGSPEEVVVNSLPATFSPLFASLSPELYDVALNKIVNFVTTDTVNQARDAVAFLCNSLVRANPEKAIAKLVPPLIANIRVEIEENGAASTRTIGSEVLPRDQSLVWYISMLSMSVVHVGASVMKYEKELYDIAIFMQEKCKGIPTVHISNYIHHLLLNLTSIYSLDYKLYEKDILERPGGPTAKDWAQLTKPEDLHILWHTPNEAEIKFAMRLFKEQAEKALTSLDNLIGDQPPIARDGTGKAWSDEVSRNLVLLRLILSGSAVLWDTRYGRKGNPNGGYIASSGSSEAVMVDDDVMSFSTGADMAASTPSGSPSEEEDSDDDESSIEPNLGERDEEDKPMFQYPTGYSLEPGTDSYESLHVLREKAGDTLHLVHEFLTKNQEDDVQCFNALYNAYRSWFIDVGIERSAHILDRVMRLYNADIGPYKFSGLRKEYPRPLLVRRANLYHLQRLRYAANPRRMNEREKVLLLDLVHSCFSGYTEVRRTAQGACEYSVKVVSGARPLVVPALLNNLEDALKRNDHPRIKGGMFALLFGSLVKTLQRDWRYAPRLIRLYIDVVKVDKPSIHALATNAMWSVVEMGRQLERMAIINQDNVAKLAGFFSPESKERQDKLAEKKRRRIGIRWNKIEEKKAQLAEELVDITEKAHWKTASRTAMLLVGLGMRFDSIAKPSIIRLVVRGMIDVHPTLRGYYHGALLSLFILIDARAVSGHDYRRFLLMDEDMPNKTEVEVPADQQPEWTEKFFGNFAKNETQYFVDAEWVGWLVWKKKIPVYVADPSKCRDPEYDTIEQGTREEIASHITKDYLEALFAFYKQEPRDASADRLRQGNVSILHCIFDLVFDGITPATVQDVKGLINDVLGDGTDKHQHRATAEILGGMMSLVHEKPMIRDQVWEYVFPIIGGLFKDKALSPETIGYWDTLVHALFRAKDPRRMWPLLEHLAGFRLDMKSNAAFKESSRIYLLNAAIGQSWLRFQLEKPLVENFEAHLDHPYKTVREAMGVGLTQIYQSRYHESYKDVQTLLEAQRGDGTGLGVKPYQTRDKLRDSLEVAFGNLEKWRLEHKTGDTASPYVTSAKTLLLFLDGLLAGASSSELVPFFSTHLAEPILRLMDVKEDTDLQALAYHVFRQLPNVPSRAGEDAPYVETLARVGRESPSWHQRMRVLINVQVLYFRRLFLMSVEQQKGLFDCVSNMLEDPQLEVRQMAQATLSGMIQCSPKQLREEKIKELRAHFIRMLNDNPLPKRNRTLPKSTTAALAAAGGAGNGSPSASGISTPTNGSISNPLARVPLRRHAAVLGLGALVTAFPYASPPPEWLPGVLATLASKAAGDPGVTGQGAKQILADFKKQRQDTWHVDVKVSYTMRCDQLLIEYRCLNQVSWKI
jgi:proteasome activator subunit 4